MNERTGGGRYVSVEKVREKKKGYVKMESDRKR